LAQEVLPIRNQESIVPIAQIHQGKDAPLSTAIYFIKANLSRPAVAAEDLDGLDETSKKGRSLYFLRRSIGTLHEFADALNEVNRLPELRICLSSPGADRHLKGAVVLVDFENKQD
jgi:hypothetical protein